VIIGRKILSGIVKRENYLWDRQSSPRASAATRDRRIYMGKGLNGDFHREMYPDLPRNRAGKTATSSETFSIISQVYTEFRLYVTY
jgi:hypothetical protein